MKIDVADYVASCLVCQKAKIEPLDIPQWKWDSISMDFDTHLPWSLQNALGTQLRI